MTNWKKIKSYAWNFKCLERDKYTCQVCGKKDRILVHHKDNSRKTGHMNNRLDNLITLCHHCHAKEHGFNEGIRKEERNQAIMELITSGLSYAEVGNLFGISRQRVEEVYKRDGGTSSCDFTQTA